MAPIDELTSFLQAQAPSTAHPNNPLAQGEGFVPSANPSNLALNEHMPGAFNNPSNPNLNANLPGALTNPSNPQFNPNLPSAENNPSNPTRNPNLPSALTNPSSPQMNQNLPGALTNPSNPMNNPDIPTPSEYERPQGISEDASLPPSKWSSYGWMHVGALPSPQHLQQSYPTVYHDFPTNYMGWSGRYPTVWHDGVLHIGPEATTHHDLLRSMEERGYEVPEDEWGGGRAHPLEWGDLGVEGAGGWIGHNPEAIDPDPSAPNASEYEHEPLYESFNSWGEPKGSPIGYDTPYSEIRQDPEQFKDNGNWYGWYRGYQNVPQEVTDAMKRYDQWFLTPRISPEQASGMGHALKFADNFTNDSREWPDPTNPRPSKVPLQQGCTCHEGLKLECPIHGMNPVDGDLDRSWTVQQANPVGYPHDSPREWTQAYSAWTPPSHLWSVERFGPMPQDREGTLNWQPGNPGKGIIIDGVPHTWNTEDLGGSPHHNQYTRTFSEERPSMLNTSDWITIGPDGHYTSEGYSAMDPKDPTLFARVQPGMKYVPDVDRWSRKVWSKQADYYHVAPTEDRARIQQHGLLPSLPTRNDRWDPDFLRHQPEAVYATDPEALGYDPDPERSRFAPEELGEYVPGRGHWDFSAEFPQQHNWDVWRIPSEQVRYVDHDVAVTPEEGAVSIHHRVFPELYQGGPEAYGPWPERGKQAKLTSATFKCPHCGAQFWSAGRGGFTPVEAQGPAQYGWVCPHCGLDFRPAENRPLCEMPTYH